MGRNGSKTTGARMMSRNIHILLAGLLVLGLAGGSTVAYLNDSTTNAENIFRVGTVSVGLDPTSTAFDVPTLAPGGQVTETIGVKNDGSLPFAFTMSARKTAGFADVYDALTCTVTSVDATSALYSGALAGLASAPSVVAPGSVKPLMVTVGLPASAGNDISGDYCKVSFDVAAEQQH